MTNQQPYVDDPWERAHRFRIGTFSPSFWAGVVQLQLQRMDADTRVHMERRVHPERMAMPFDGFGASLTHDLGIFDADAFFLVIAIHRILVLADLLQWQGVEGVAAAVENFNRECPHAKSLRDLLTHLDEYATGRGKYREEFKAERYWWPSTGLDFNLRVGTQKVELRQAAAAAVMLAQELNTLTRPS